MNSLYMIAGLLAVAVMIGIIIFNPFFGLYIFTILLYLKPGMFGVVFATMHLTRIIGIVTFLVFLFQTRRKGMIRFSQNAQSRLLILFTIMIGLSIVTSIWRANTIEMSLNFLKVIVSYFLIVNLVNSVNRYRAVIWAMVLSGFFIAVTSLHSYYGSGAVIHGERMFGAFRGILFGNPNDLALAFIMLIPFLYYDLFRKGAFVRKIIQVAMIGIFFLAFVMTQSRGGLLGMSIMLGVIWFRSRNKVPLAIAGIVLLIIGWNMSPQAYKDRMMTISEAHVEDSAATSRLDAWKAGLKMMRTRAFGVGVGNFGEGFVQYRPAGAVDYAGMRRAAHNMFIQVGGETGIPGLVIFVLLIGSAFKSLNKVKKCVYSGANEKKPWEREMLLLSDATFISLTGYCASGMFLSQGYNFILFYLIAFSVVLEHLVLVKIPGALDSQNIRNTLKNLGAANPMGVASPNSRGELATAGKWKSRALSAQLEKK